MFEVFEYKKKPRPPRDRRTYRRPPSLVNQENLTGVVQGQQASDIEERFARALAKTNLVASWKFSVYVDTPFQLPGQENEVDFFVWAGVLYPIEVDGEFAHKSAGQRAGDKERDAVLGLYLQKRYPGSQPIERIPGYELDTQDKADALVRRMF